MRIKRRRRRLVTRHMDRPALGILLGMTLLMRCGHCAGGLCRTKCDCQIVCPVPARRKARSGLIDRQPTKLQAWNKVTCGRDFKFYLMRNDVLLERPTHRFVAEVDVPCDLSLNGIVEPFLQA